LKVILSRNRVIQWVSVVAAIASVSGASKAAALARAAAFFCSLWSWYLSVLISLIASALRFSNSLIVAYMLALSFSNCLIFEPDPALLSRRSASSDSSALLAQERAAKSSENLESSSFSSYIWVSRSSGVSPLPSHSSCFSTFSPITSCY